MIEIIAVCSMFYLMVGFFIAAVDADISGDDRAVFFLTFFWPVALVRAIWRSAKYWWKHT